MNRSLQMRRLFAVVCLCFAAVCPAAEPAAAPAKRVQPARWLLILDTSAAMEKRAKALEGVAAELLGSAMGGKMKAGDELGIWSYNKELYAGVAPMQAWEPARSNLITSRTIEFLGRQVYRDKAKIENVLPELASVARESRELTVIWFSDGSQKFAGTPYDDEINAATAKLKPALENSRMPIITVLRVYHGKLFAQKVSLAPWPVEFAPFPSEQDATNAVVKLVAAAPKPAPMAKPIIITSPKKTNAEPVAEASVKLRPLPAEVAAEATNVPVAVPVSAPATTPPTTPLVAQVQPAPAVVPPLPVSDPKPISAAPVAPAATSPVAPAPASVAKPEPAAPTVQPVQPPAVTPVAAAAVSTHATPVSSRWPLIAGAGFMVAAAVVALVLARRSRRPAPASLITQSFERGDK